MLRQLTKLMDAYSQRLTDSNSKVAMSALQSMPRIFASLRDSMESVLHILVPNLSNNLAATNDKIRSVASDVIDSLISNMDPTSLLPAFSNVVTHGNPRVRSAMLSKIQSALLVNIFRF